VFLIYEKKTSLSLPSKTQLKKYCSILYKCYIKQREECICAPFVKSQQIPNWYMPE
jgi:hypothetical protein